MTGEAGAREGNGEATTPVARFEAAARDANVSVTRATTADLTTILGDVIDPPAVGTALPFEGTLPGFVETDPTPSEIEAAQTGVTAAAFGIAEHGSVAIASSEAGEEPTSLYPECHVAVVAASDLVPGVGEAVEKLAALAAEGRDAVVATGPSATADMGELVLGAHGPREVHVVIVEDI